ncbi:MAG TPA: right-handed parallel beta-helix repeat-containing protein [Dysgonamonadaceae bacterium]|nr:right-handed parallel beta-helix repeat-containing protein [Dysgonamonadaceae bacterium]
MKAIIYRAIMVIALLLTFSFTVDAQINLKKLGNTVKRSAEQQVEQKIKEKAARETREALDRGEKKLDQSVSNATAGKAASGNKAIDQGGIPHDAETIYVSANNGSNRNDGSLLAPLKDLQKAIDIAPEGALICLAEGNYLGYLDQGWVKVNKYVSIVGGYSDNFSQRDPIRYRTTMRPGVEQIMTSGNQGVMDIRVMGKRNGVVLVDGIIFDRGQINLYIAPIYDDDRASAPEGCETGRIVNVDETPPLPVIEPAGMKSAFQLISGEMEGNLTIRNCVFLNGYHFGIQMACKGGHFDINNNVFVANRMAACEVRGGLAQPNTSYVEFHNNTLLFTWCRTKHMEDMGYGFRYMTGIDADVYNNIVGCSNYGGLDRAYVDADKNKEGKRVTSAWNNLFFGNRNGDMVLPSGGGGWTFVLSKNFEDVNQLTKYENNREMNEAEVNAISNKIDAPYLKGFIGITGTQTSEFNPNSSINQFRNALGMNMQGTETVRVSMYANRYPYEKVFDLFGAIEGYGAQRVY